ncbi:MAG TPA: lysylphosphatidylglycerol synthase transmembrane domain-containing protein [Pirellula sp.]|nr:lysylphosphatidylglycerol synthase transmembrane domain-containing protein [Pirellula sp.]
MQSSHSATSRFLAVIKIAILIAIVAWLIYSFPQKNWDALVHQDKNWFLLGQAFLIILIAHLFSYFRWQILVKSLGVSFSLLEAIRLGFLGTLLNLVSVGSVGGDVFKAIEAARKAEKKRAEVVTSVLVDRALGLLGLVIVAGIGLSIASTLSPRMRLIQGGAILLSVVGLAVVFSIVLFGHRVPIMWINRIPVIGPALHRVCHACMIFQGRPRLVLELLGSSFMVHSCFTIACALISNSLYAETPTLAEHFMTIPPALAAATLPLTPGGVGVQEMAIDNLFRELPNLPAAFSGLIVASVFRGLVICVTLVGAIYYFLGIGKR